MTLKFTLTLAMTVLALPALAAGTGKPSGSTYDLTLLVSDQTGVAQNTDPDLVNPWGISHITGGPNWVADNGTDKSTVYNRTSGTKSLAVGVAGAPTGTVANSGGGFVVSENGKQGSSTFLFDTESGTLLGWSSSVDPNNAVVAVDNSASGAVYKGLAIDPTTKQIYAANFTKNQVEIYNNSWGLVGTFTDTALPKRFAPFNVALLNGKLYVAFAKREKGGIDEVHGKGLGYVDVFDTAGNLQQRLIANGKLNAPWGMTIAPSGFGQFAGALLVGNFGNGHINAYDAATGDALGTLKGSDGKALALDGLWTVDTGPGTNQVTFSAGPDDESHGLLGLITLH